MPEIYRELIKLAESDSYPFHMPGHKRNEISTPFEGAFRCDITEIDGFDNLHDESGIILEAQRRANRLYGAEETYFLVNGSTCGVLSAVSATVPKGGVILAARGSHKALYHAAYLRDLEIRYLPYKINSGYDIPEAYTAEDIMPFLSSDVDAVFITSPTYEGKCSEVHEIVRICHEKKIPLIVDAAHGAHFGFGDMESKGNGSDFVLSEQDLYTRVPESAVTHGADIVIHSVHKTLPSMTQTALIHINGELIDRALVKRYLRIYQSSSPSYVLMASIDRCMEEMESRGRDYIDRLLHLRNLINIETRELQNIYIPGSKVIDDPCKVLILDASGTMTGQQIYDILREEYALQLEMAGQVIALAIITGSDSEDGIKRLIEAVKAIDKKIEGIKDKNSSAEASSFDREKILYRDIPSQKIKLTKAWDSPREQVPIDAALGRCAGDFINLYPPGIPIIVPGEVFSKDIVKEIKTCRSKELNLQGCLYSRESKEILVEVIKE